MSGWPQYNGVDGQDPWVEEVTRLDNCELVAYRLDTAKRDHETMQHLYASRDYHWALFMGRLVIEKLLKALVVARESEKQRVPLSHDLLLLAERAGIELNERQKDLLDLFTTFNISARYPDYKESFYRKCTSEYTAKRIQEIEEVRAWLLSNLRR